MNTPAAIAVIALSVVLGYALVRFIFWCAEYNQNITPRDNIDAGRETR